MTQLPIFGSFTRVRPIALGILLGATALLPVTASAQTAKKYAASWSAASTTTYNPSVIVAPDIAAPSLSYAIPDPAVGANEQTFRMIVKPDLWGHKMRVRLSNVFGSQPVTFASVTVSLQAYAANVVEGTGTQVYFGGQTSVTLPAGQEVFSDEIVLGWVQAVGDPNLSGRNMAVTFYVQGQSGPITFSRDLKTTSYIAPPGSGDRTGSPDDEAFPYATTSGFFLNAVDVRTTANTSVVCCFGDSITNGYVTTLNGNDRWTNVLSRRLHGAYGNAVTVVNEGLDGNRVTGHGSGVPNGSGASASDRLDRDVLGLSGLTHVIWLEGINDLNGGATVESIIAGYQDVVGRLHARGIPVTGGTLTSSLNPTLTPGSAAYASNQQTESRRRQLNDYIRTSGLFDDGADCDAATTDPATGQLAGPFLSNSTIGASNAAPDYLHPNRVGNAVMADAVNLSALAPTGP